MLPLRRAGASGLCARGRGLGTSAAGLRLAYCRRVFAHLGVGVETNGIPFWGRCTTHFRTYFSRDWDVHWGYVILTHGHLGVWLKIKQLGLRRFWSTCPFTRVPCWTSFFEPHPFRDSCFETDLCFCCETRGRLEDVEATSYDDVHERMHFFRDHLVRLTPSWALFAVFSLVARHVMEGGLYLSRSLASLELCSGRAICTSSITFGTETARIPIVESE